jgi:UDP-glucose 4-epimerase
MNREYKNGGSRPVTLVTGATGTIGPFLVQRLLDQGYEVRVLLRRQPSPDLLHRSVQIFLGDITDSRILNKAAAGADVILHLAAKLHINDPDSANRKEYHRVNVEGTKRLVEAAQSAHISRLVFFSTINVYGPSQPGVLLDENSDTDPNSWYAETKLLGEQIALAGVPTVSLRLAAVYGPRMKGNYLRLMHALRRGRFVMIGNGMNRRTLIHTYDVCSAALLAAEHPSAVGQIYNVTDGEVYTVQEILEAICRGLGKERPKLCLPVKLARFCTGVFEDVSKTFGLRSSISRAMIEKFMEQSAVSGEKIQRELGFRPEYDLWKGWQEIVRELTAGE